MCSVESDQASCDARTNCVWNEAGSGDTEEAEAGTEAGEAAPDMPLDPDMIQGVCAPNPMSAGVDERCERRTDSCMANLCLPQSFRITCCDRAHGS